MSHLHDVEPALRVEELTGRAAVAELIQWRVDWPVRYVVTTQPAGRPLRHAAPHPGV
jgi:hypothetical protein